MDAHREPSITMWIDGELAVEDARSAATAGQLPERPIRLTEVEALALLLLATDAHLHPNDGPIGPVAASRLADLLRSRLGHLHL